MRYTVIMEKSDEDYFVFVPALPGCTSSGKTQGEALENIREAIILTQEYMKDNGILLPNVQQMVAEVEA